ncbi:MAG: type II secretion system F family protein, partial [Planctomycetota bacterium]
LFRAGYRGPNATPTFMVLNAIALLVGLGVAFLLYQSSVVQLGSVVLRAIPGSVGEVFLPLLWSSPAFAVGVVVLAPALVVRARRRKRVQQIEIDLPLTLDLLATLAEAGLSFDAALERVLETQRAKRPLADEFRLFRLEILTGRSRIDSLRRLKDNINVPWFSIFVSALIHAEQIGASLASTLRAQADDLRNRRRERALAQAMAVPVKLLFPLIVCFLPGIMIASLGPIIFQIAQQLDQLIGNVFG